MNVHIVCECECFVRVCVSDECIRRLYMYIRYT